MDREPLEGEIKVVRSLMVVDFPAPFGPKNPKTWPDWTENWISSTALIEPYDFDRCITSIHDTMNLQSSH